LQYHQTGFRSQPKTAMEQRVSIITLGVSDLDRSRKFYERLGWRPSIPDTKDIVFFQAGGIALALFPRANLVKDARISADGEGFGGVSLAYNARSREEVDSVLAEAKAAGANLPKPAQNAFWGGYSGYFSDPDGFLWEIAWNPSFPIAEDGSIRVSG
jgi:predicted lactoylglutathione lyase